VDDGRQRLDCGHLPADLARAVVGHDDPAHTDGSARDGIGGLQQSLGDNGQRRQGHDPRQGLGSDLGIR
jgi:hypothetical protein